MIEPGVFSVEPWAVAERELRLDLLAQTESIFALSNGHIGLRGNLDEGEPHGIPGTYLNGFFESLPLPYAEGGYGYPEEGQSLIDVTNGKLFRLLVDDEPFDVRYGTLLRHERVLDLRDGVLRREVEWTSPAGKAVRVRSTRLVSFVQRAVAAILLRGRGARRAGADRRPVDARRQRARPGADRAIPARPPRCARRSSASTTRTTTSRPRSGTGRAPAVCGWQPGSTMWSTGRRDGDRVGERAGPGARHDQHGARARADADGGQAARLRLVERALDAGAARSGRRGARGGEANRLGRARRRAARVPRRRLGDRADVEVEGDPQLQQAVRFGIFQVVQAAARAEQRAIPAKGLTGRGYDGHTFWDMETYTLPVLTYTAPLGRARRAALAALDARPGARARARAAAGGRGVPVADDSRRGVLRLLAGRHGGVPHQRRHRRRGPPLRRRDRRHASSSAAGLELLVETARLWLSLGHHDAEGCFRIDGVTGPDEYTALVDNNVFTNLMAARNLRRARPRRPGGTPSERPSSASTSGRSRRGGRPPQRSSCRSTTSSA